MSTQRFQYNNQFLDRIVVSMLTDQSFLLRCMDLEMHQYIESQPHEWFVKFIIDFFKDYKVIPTMDSLKVKIQSIKQTLLKQALSTTYISILNAFEQNNLQFIKNTVIQFCRFQQVKKAITKSIQLLQNESQDLQSIYQIINKTRFKGMQADLGVQYVDAFQKRHTKESKRIIPTPWSVLNNALNGGTKESTLNLVLAPPGCVTQDTKILVKIEDVIKEIEIHQVQNYLKENIEIKVETLGSQKNNPIFTKITDYIKKGTLDTYLLKTESGKCIKVSNDHLFFRQYIGWSKTRELEVGDKIFCSHYEYETIIQKTLVGKYPIVDITVQHPQACYYGNNILNHNSGKSWMLVNIAAHCLKLGKKVVYYTLEMTQDEVGCRIDYKLLDKPEHYLSDPQNFQKCIKLIQPYRNNLRIKQFMPNLSTISQIENHFTQMKLFDDFQADVVIIDYADIIKKQSGGDNMYISYGDVYTNLKRFAKTYKKVVWSASQGNRCLDVKTLVKTKQNGTIMIGDINIGDHIEIPYGFSKVKDIFKSSQTAYKIKFKDGRQVICSANHLFPTKYGNLESIETGLTSGKKVFMKRLQSLEN